MRLALILVAWWASLSAAWAQQTIFNVPSADVTPPGRLFLQHEAQWRAWKPGRFINNTEYAALGVGHNTEVDVTLFNVSAPSLDNMTLGLGFKSALPLFKQRWPERDIKLTVGSVLPVSLQGQGVGNWSYAHGSLRLPKLNTRLTGGLTAGTQQVFGRNTVAAIAGVEHPVSKRVTLLADWYSGTHGLGLLITGVSISLPRDTALYLGYQIPNNRRCGRSGFVIEFAKVFF